jgi:hypothetical protein
MIRGERQLAPAGEGAREGRVVRREGRTRLDMGHAYTFGRCTLSH